MTLQHKEHLIKLPNFFKEEEKALLSRGIHSWISLMNLKDKEIFEIVNCGLSTSRNLKRLRCIAMFVCELKIPQEEAALLMHSGIPSIKALAVLTPHDLIGKIGRLERLLSTQRESVINLKKASNLIQKAKDRQSIN